MHGYMNKHSGGIVMRQCGGSAAALARVVEGFRFGAESLTLQCSVILICRSCFDVKIECGEFAHT